MKTRADRETERTFLPFKHLFDLTRNKKFRESEATRPEEYYKERLSPVKPVMGRGKVMKHHVSRADDAMPANVISGKCGKREPSITRMLKSIFSYVKKHFID